MAFIEKGYTWVFDADVSSGEMDDGSYIVFVEMERDSKVPEHIMDLMTDLMNLTEQDLSDWRVRYFKSRQETKFSPEALEEMIPLSPEEYNRLYGDNDLTDLKTSAGIKVDKKAPRNEFTETLRNWAGIIR